MRVAPGEDRPRPRSGAVLAFAAGLVVAFACDDPYQHTNLYDPATPLDASLAGPDTILSSGQLAQYHVVSTPAFADTAGAWNVLPNQMWLKSAGNGAFLFFPPPVIEPDYDTVQVVVELGAYDTTKTTSNGGGMSFASVTQAYRRRYVKTVLLTQRVTRIQLRCPDVHVCDTMSVGGSWSVWIDGFDQLNQALAGLTGPTQNRFTGLPIATFTVRDPSVAGVAPIGIRAANVTALKTGSTWIVASRDSLRDSLQLIVH
jgi:hypothetical protein